jgi:hypothetical protein
VLTAKSGKCRGVCRQSSGRWAAEIRDARQGRSVWLGRAYDREAYRIRGKSARLNLPLERWRNLPRNMDLNLPATPDDESGRS